MSRAPTLRPSDRAVKDYYAKRLEHEAHGVQTEEATRTAFLNLLDAAARKRKWSVIPEQYHARRGRRVKPDATVYDAFHVPRGHWEAKDTDDDLDAEIAKKIAKGYPTNNTIFEDTRAGVLYQDDAEALRVDLSDPAALCDLLNAFLRHTEPDLERFDQAIEAFKDRVPALGAALAKTLDDAHRTNPAFVAAFARLLELCRESLNPNLRREAVDEMLVQHLLTERLIRKIFDSEDFRERNVIAAEIEKVVRALAGQGFSRRDFMRQLDVFYVAIEEAADGIEDFADKQHFLNTVYERFFQGYSVRLADTMGIVYTPQPIVDFMCNSVEQVLRREFDRGLGDDDVHVLDPCTGTGNFVVNLLNRVPRPKLADFYRHRLFANEVMLLPYYVAALNVEKAYYDRAGAYEPFEGLCFVDTLDLSLGRQAQLGFMNEANTARVERQKRAPITVIVGNPPYNVGQTYDNERNKNRVYKEVDQRISDTYAKSSSATSVSKLSDAYVKFFRWAADRFHNNPGILCFVSNNSFVHRRAFDGMRKHLQREFPLIYHYDLAGDVRENPTLSGTAYNVFGIQVGVGITLAVRVEGHRKPVVHYAKLEKTLRRAQKLLEVERRQHIGEGDWQVIEPRPDGQWLRPENEEEYESFLSLSGESQAIFTMNTLGVATHRDAIVYDFDRDRLAARLTDFIESYNSEIDRYKRAGRPEEVDDFVRYDGIVWDRDLKRDLKRENYTAFQSRSISPAMYRPFTKRWLYYDGILNAEIYSMPRVFPASRQVPNVVICCSDKSYRSDTFSALIVNAVPDLHLCATLDGHQCFPFYTYSPDGTGRRENVTDWALARFRDRYGDAALSKWDVFHYVYGLLHHPGYRSRFADNLKRSLPRVPLAPDFAAFRDAGRALADLHLNYEAAAPWSLNEGWADGAALTYRVDRMRLSKDGSSVRVNDALTLGGLPPEARAYRLGNRSAVEWVVDQYRAKTDDRTGVTSDPNDPADERSVVDLLARVARVSVETVRIVDDLPADFGGGG